VFLTAISISIGLLSSKIHNGDGIPQDSNVGLIMRSSTRPWKRGDTRALQSVM